MEENRDYNIDIWGIQIIKKAQTQTLKNLKLPTTIQNAQKEQVAQKTKQTNRKEQE